MRRGTDRQTDRQTSVTNMYFVLATSHAKCNNTCPYNTSNVGLLTAEIGLPVWAPQHISTGFAYQLRYCSDVGHRRPTKLCTMFGMSPGLLHYIDIFCGSCPLTEFYVVQNSPYVSLAFSYIGSVTARRSSSGREPNFVAWYREWNDGTFADGTTYIRLGGHHVGHRPTF